MLISSISGKKRKKTYKKNFVFVFFVFLFFSFFSFSFVLKSLVRLKLVLYQMLNMLINFISGKKKKKIKIKN